MNTIPTYAPYNPITADDNASGRPSSHQTHAGIGPWSIQSNDPNDILQATPTARLAVNGQPGATSKPAQQSHAPGSSEESKNRTDTLDNAYAKLDIAGNKISTSLVQLNTALWQLPQRQFLASAHSAISGLGNLLDGAGDGAEGLSDLLQSQKNTLGHQFEETSKMLRSVGTPLRSFGNVMRDLDELVTTYSNEKADATEIKLAFNGFLNSLARESGESVSVLNTTAGSANTFLNALAAGLRSTGNIGLGLTRVIQNLPELTSALRESHPQAAASAMSGTLAGVYFAGGGLTLALSHALAAAGYHGLSERLALLNERLIPIGESYEAMQGQFHAIPTSDERRWR
jgi:hypothetical protein